MRDEVDFILVQPSDSCIVGEQVEPFARVYRLPFKDLSRSLGSILCFAPRLLYCSWRLRRLLAHERCGRVQLNDFFFVHGTVLRLLGFGGQMATWVRLDPLRFRLGGKLSLALARRSSTVVAVSETVRQRLPKPAEVELIYEPTPDYPVLGSSEKQRLLFIGNYLWPKGQDVAITAFHRLAEKFPNAELVFHGTDAGSSVHHAYLAELKEQARRGPGGDRIHFNGFVSRPTDVLQHARAALCFSRSESFGLVCQEASAHGIPVIATRCGGPEEIVEDGKTGYLIDVDDVSAMADRMERLLSDLELARTMGMAGAELVRSRFSAERFRSRIRDIFRL